MSWNFKLNKVGNVNKNNMACTIDEIVQSEELQKIRQKYNLSQSILHKFVTEFIIKVYVEKKMKEEDILKYFDEIPSNVKLELIKKVEDQAKNKGLA